MRQRGRRRQRAHGGGSSYCPVSPTRRSGGDGRPPARHYAIHQRLPRPPSAPVALVVRVLEAVQALRILDDLQHVQRQRGQLRGGRLRGGGLLGLHSEGLRRRPSLQRCRNPAAADLQCRGVRSHLQAQHWPNADRPNMGHALQPLSAPLLAMLASAVRLEGCAVGARVQARRLTTKMAQSVKGASLALL